LVAAVAIPVFIISLAAAAAAALFIVAGSRQQQQGRAAAEGEWISFFVSSAAAAAWCHTQRNNVSNAIGPNKNEREEEKSSRRLRCFMDAKDVVCLGTFRSRELRAIRAIDPM
jgi:hypothetical protein